MTEIGYALSSEEHTPADLARYARRAEEAVRREMLEEAVEVIRLLWRGGSQSHRGRHYTVENARIYTLPPEPPPIMVAASGPKAAELALPAHFEAAVAHVEEQDVAESVVCGHDPQRHVEAITEFVDAGYDHVYLHQIGPEQDGFFDFYESEVLPKLDGGGRKG